MKLEPAFADAARLLTSFALDPSLGVRHSDLHLRLHCAWDRALALRRIGGSRHRRSRVATLRLARVAAEARVVLDRWQPRSSSGRGRAA